MSQEPISHWFSTRISWRVASTNDLNALELHKLLIRLSVESLALDNLTKE
jgi:hypothetical protein